MIKLENQSLTAEFSVLGAELQRLYNKDSKLEYLWNAYPIYWAKHSPVLFPIVGSLKDDTYVYAGNTYKMGRHGFAREKTFRSKQISDTEILFTLEDDEATRLIYPFNFLLQVRYRLDGNALWCSYEVSNPGASDLYFSLGAHPAFAVPNSPGLNYTDYFLDFNSDQSLTRWKLKDGLISDSTESIPLNDKKLKLSPDLFYEDAIVLKDLGSDEIRLGNTKNQHGLVFHFEDFPYFGIWAAKDAPFICLEPWCGIADNVNSTERLIDKEGIIKLAAGEHWEREWWVEVY